MIQTPKGKYYVYTLARSDDRVFYVGKGLGNRVNSHEREARTNHDCHRCNIIRKIWRAGGQVKIEVVATFTREADAYEREAQLIRLYDIRTLANIQPGESGFIVAEPNRFATYNAVAIKARLLRRGVSADRQREILEEWHKEEIKDLKNSRVGSRRWGDPEMLQHIEDQITAHKVALGKSKQWSFDDLL